MARYAMIKDGIVFNVAEWDGKTEWSPNCEIIECPDEFTGSPGDTWDGKKFITPEELPNEESLTEMFIEAVSETLNIDPVPPVIIGEDSLNKFGSQNVS